MYNAYYTVRNWKIQMAAEKLDRNQSHIHIKRMTCIVWSEEYYYRMIKTSENNTMRNVPYFVRRNKSFWLE